MLNQGITSATNSVDTSSSSSRSVIGFPIVIVLLISGVIIFVELLYCCCRRNRNRSLSQSSLDAAYLEEVITVDQSHSQGKLKYPDDYLKQRQNEISIPVSMPGDEIPKFIALPCPLEPPREVEMKKITVDRHPYTSNTSTHCTMVTLAHS